MVTVGGVIHDDSYAQLHRQAIEYLLAAQPGVEGVAQTVAQEIERQYSSRQRNAGNENNMRV